MTIAKILILIVLVSIFVFTAYKLVKQIIEYKKKKKSVCEDKQEVVINNDNNKKEV